MTFALSLAIVLFLAYANGSNDNFKGVATLFGSGAATYDTAIRWSTVATALGSLAASVFAGGLLATFRGKGLVPDDVVAMPSFSLAVVLDAARIGSRRRRVVHGAEESSLSVVLTIAGEWESLDRRPLFR